MKASPSILIFSLASHASAFTFSLSISRPKSVEIHAGRSKNIDNSSNNGEFSQSLTDRRSMLQKAAALGGLAFMPLIADAKVEGYAPPNKALSEEYRQGTAALADMDEQAPVPKEAYKKLSSGVVYADLRTGSGEEAKDGSRVNLQWVLRKSNGYFVDSSEVNDSVPFIYTVGDNKAIQGVDEGVRGMKVGGVRRLLIPVNMAYVDGLEDGKPGPLPVGFGPRQQMRRIQTVRKDVPGEYVFLEVQLTRMR
mmetsp:Transcript_19931/g.28221  ORF Transcript_19931/g.28221 Transcript_19931/m.28221 type:complete len:251 (+) Transcript_19931:120-872(+)